MLTPAQLTHFDKHGFVVVENILDQATVLDPLKKEYDQVLTNLCKAWAEQGKLAPGCCEMPFDAKLLSVYRAGLDYFQPLDISLPPGDISTDIPFHAGPAIFDVITNSNLLDKIESIIGSEITSNPIQHVRIKPPVLELARNELRPHITKTEWHQDRAVTLQEADATRMVTAWLAISEATVENGCLQVIPGSHESDMKHHCPQPQLGIPENFIDLQAAVPLPVPAGGAVFFHPLTIHGSLENKTQGFRWSFDLRYNVTGDPTGRSFFPEFIARSKDNPQSVLTDSTKWRQLWEQARSQLASEGAVQIHRWSADSIHCA